MNTETDRERGVLSPADRAYLLGERAMSHDQSKRNAEARIRRRIRAGMLDFDLLLHTLAEKDRRQVFERATDEALLEGVRAMVAFAYLGLEESGTDFADVLEPAVRSCEEYLAAAESDETVSVDVTFEVETTVESSLSGVVSRLEDGEPVTPRELFTLIMRGDHDSTAHDRITLVAATDDDLTDGFLERLAAYLGGELRHVTDSRAVIDLGDGGDATDR